jgi:hypothetical protein
MIHIAIILFCALGIIIHAKIVDVKDKFSYYDYCIFVCLLTIPLAVIVDFLTSNI